MVYYAHKSALVHVERAEDDGFIDSINGIQIVQKGDMLAVDEFGNRYVISEDNFYNNYAPVKKMRVTKTQRKSPFEIAAIEEGYNCLSNSFESEDYINSQMELTKSKYNI